MWYQLGKWLLKFRVALLIGLFIATAIMAFYASKVQLSYEFTRAIPTDNPRYQEYQAFKARFGEDGSLLVVGVETGAFFQLPTFNALRQLHADLKTVKGVEEILSIPEAVTLIKNDSTNKLVPSKIFPSSITAQSQLDSARAVFENLPFYHGLLYN
ncbi:MAG: integral rane protein, partial [Segetibacter sp.]|nr:integral rane protein [Segetibacter sp.]